MKFHLLGHWFEDVRDVSFLHFLMASPFESSHSLWKFAFNMISKRKRTAMDESILHLQQNLDLSVSVIRSTIKSDSRKQWCSVAFTDNALKSCLVQDATTVSLADIIQCLSIIEKYVATKNISTTQYVEDETGHISIPETIVTTINRTAFSLFRILVIGGLQCFINMVRVEVSEVWCSFPSFSSCVLPDHHILLSFVKSGYIPGGFIPTLNHFDKSRGTVPFEHNKFSSRQRVFATDSFQGRKRLDWILLVGGEEHSPELWVGQLQSLFRLHFKNRDFVKELSFVRYTEYTVPVDNVDKELKCITFRWTTDDDIDHTLHPPKKGDSQEIIEVAPWYGLLDFSSICGKVNVVRSNYAVHPFSERNAWIYDRFYINRFYEYGL